MIKKILIGIGGFLLLVGFGILGRDGRRAKKAEAKADELVATGIDKDLKKADKFRASAKVHTKAAIDADKATRKLLDEVGKKDATHADTLSAWDRERLRQQSN